MKNLLNFSIALLFAMLATTEVGAGESSLELPPIMQREYGKVLVARGWGAKKVHFKGGGRNSAITSIGAPKNAAESEIAILLLNDFWDGKFREQILPELAPINREVFLKHGTAQLLGNKSDAPQIIHDWWNVRMGEPLPVSKTYQLVAVNIFKGDGGSEVGHFCIGVRKIGGDADRDFIIDLRAPWDEAEPAGFDSAINHDNALITRLIPNNFYDWLYTQGEFRGCRRDLRFCAVSDAQVRLLQTIVARKKDNPIFTGPFRPLKKNCASIGSQLMKVILPFDKPFRNGGTIADIPLPTALQMVKRMGGAKAYIVMESHQREGFPVTAASKIYPAEPSRAKSEEFLELKKVKEIN